MTGAWPFGDLPMFGFDVVMIDPPWPFELYSEAGQGKSPEAQYRTMSWAAIGDLPVGQLLAPGGVVWLWCTWPAIERQAQILRHWGYPPRTGGAWAKRTASGRLRWGTGYVLRSVCEPFLVGADPRARLSGPGLANLVETVAAAAVDGLAREHSRKPEEVYALVEALTPGARRAEIFSRTDRPGWSCWGDEAGKYGSVA